MTAVLVLLGTLFSLIVLLVVRVSLRARRRTQNFDGLEIERHHSAEIRETRAANTSIAVHNRFIDGGRDHRSPRR
ncbi:hypothetical protein ACFT7S_21805 [Streptomyces sp. NPDC057136]|uniref:hypothetical protein n=1 Tax=Streptomyces sp. NPDC057136 TaxID=3346029 RepID=UPI00363297D5